MKKTTGRPRSFAKPRARIRVIRALKRGNTRKDAAALAGGSYNTLLEEMKRDGSFAELVERAELHGKARLISTVHRGALEDPKIALSVLERKYPGEWSRSGTLKHEGTIEHSHMSVDEQRTELVDLIAALRERAGAVGNPPVAPSNGNGKHVGNGEHN